jgi:hypothetical protein
MEGLSLCSTGEASAFGHAPAHGVKLPATTRHMRAARPSGEATKELLFTLPPRRLSP